MKITVTVETDSRIGTQTVVTNTRDVAVGGPHQYEEVIPRVAEKLGQLALEQLMAAARRDAERRR